MSLIEAQAAGVPVVSTRVGGTPSVVHHGETGLLVDVDDESAFSAAVLTALERGAEMGAVGRRLMVHRFSVGRLVDDLDLLYRGLLRTT